jgi:lysozyme
MDYEKLVKSLIRHEGVMLTMYKCPAGKDTIGIGHLVKDSERVLFSRGITRKQAEQLLLTDIEDCVKSMVNFPFFSNLSDVRQRVLVELDFNLGTPRLLQFKKALAAMAAKDWSKAHDEMLDSKWATQVGHRARTLAKMMLTNEDPPFLT